MSKEQSSVLETPTGLNVAVMRGIVHKPPQWRELPSGNNVTSIDIKVVGTGTRSEILRVSWMNAPTAALEFEEGTEVVVVGRVRAYWSGRRSETDVLATSVTRSKSQKYVRRAVAESMAALQAACP